MLTIKKYHVPSEVAVACFFMMFFFSTLVQAATYSLPSGIGTSPFNTCNFVSGTTYSCSGDIEIAANDTINITSPMTLNVNGDFSIKDTVTINNGGNTFSVVATKKVTVGKTSNIQANLQAGGGTNCSVGEGSIISGQIYCDHDMTFGKNVTVNGNITVDHDLKIDDFSTVTGNITTYHNITIDKDINVTGNVIASNSLNINSGSIVNGYCSPYHASCTYTPTVTTNAATLISSNAVTLNGTVSSNTYTTTVSFNYGTTTSYGATVQATESPLASNASNAAVSRTITGLTCDTTYHFQVKGTNSNGTTFGTDLTFTTLACLPIATYHFEETSWNGTLNEVKDTAGYSGGPYDGQGIGTPKPTPATASPARSGATGTCGYATFGGSSNGGSAFTLDGLPVSASNGAKTSVSFWMYWNGANSEQSIGWSLYDLYFDNGRFGFNTGGNDIWGISSSGLANGWHHVVAIFANGNVQNSKLYIDGTLRTLSQWNGGQINNANAYVTSTLEPSGWTYDNGYRFSGGRIDELKIYNGEINQTQVTADYNATHNCLNDATLIAYYNLEETSWNGTANETKDTAGYSGGPFDGQGIGTQKPTPATASPARSGATGTCGYATFGGSVSGGSAFTLDDLPVSTSNGKKTSVSFWMYWNGTSSVMPIGWGSYDLWFSGGYFGFNTASSDIYGISSSGLENGWHHVVAVFTNGGVTSNKIYIDGVNQSLSQRLGSPSNSRAVVQSTIQVSGWARDNGYRFVGGSVDQLKIYNGEISSTQVTSDYNETHACPSYSVTPSSFNCVATGATAGTGNLYTQLAGAAFNIDVVALNSSNTVETSYVASGTKNVTLEFVDGSGSTACASRTALSPAVSQTVSFAVSDAGRKTTSITISKASRDLVCRVTDANQSPSVVKCSTDHFSVRPSSFTVTATGSADADSTGVSTTNIPKITASNNPNFTLTATTNIAGYDGTPQIDNAKLSAHTGAIQAGTLSGSFSAANSATGNATASVGYSEVGYFRFAKDGVIDTSFTAIDSASGDCTTDASNTLVGGKYGCYISNQSNTNYFGRFIPGGFNVDDVSVTSANACGSFTYYGQDGFNSQFILRAQNENGVRTRNYHGSYAKLDINTWTDNTASTGLKFLATNLPSGVNLLAGTSSPTGSWSQGQATIYATHKLSRPSSAVAPVNLVLKTNPIDSDGVIVINNNPEAANVPANSLFRYGRLWIPNVYGSELLNLTVPVEAQYWSSTGVYQRNQLDSCTAIAPANIAMANYKGNLAACETVISGGGTMASGKTTMTLSKPGNGNNGSVDLSLNLNSTAGSTCTSSTASSATNANLPQFGTSNPTARETFGLFKSPVIYMRENY